MMFRNLLAAGFLAAAASTQSASSSASDDSTVTTTVTSSRTVISSTTESVLSMTLSWTSPNAASSADSSSSPNSSSSANASSSSRASATTSGKYPVTTDNSCGSTVNRTCLLTGINPCCSGDGFCGGTAEYCGSGCQEDFGSCSAPDATLGAPACSWAGEGTSPRCDGRCGREFSNAVCSTTASPDAFARYGVFGYGPCCSDGGFCGSTDAHCGVECQSGCNGTNDDDAGAAGATVTVTASAASASASTASATRRRVVGASAASGGTVALVLLFVGALLVI